MSKLRCENCQEELGDGTVCLRCGHIGPGAPPCVVCQHCRREVDGFPVLCPHCGQKLASVTATHYLGQTVPLSVRNCMALQPEQAKKKISPYLKLCDYFLCSSELALIRVKVSGKT